jgi:hypothetical protein
MGLYLCIFDGEDDELAGFQVGHYSDFGFFRDTIARHLDPLRYPTLMEHSDSDGKWSATELPGLKQELVEIADRFKKLLPEEPVSAFEHTAHCRADASSLYDCYHSVDEENLFEALIGLCDVGIEAKKPISFQ